MTLNDLIEAFERRGEPAVFDDSHPDVLTIKIADEILHIEKHPGNYGTKHADSHEVRDRLRSHYEMLQTLGS